MTAIATLAREATLRQDVRKSRFVARASPVESVDAALAFIANVAVSDATHNCWAYRIGADYRFNDDGEPGGSAGRPILLAIDGQAMDQVVVVVTRWYGGIKLGVGGLARAYGGCAAECLRLAERRALVTRVRVQVHCDFAAVPVLFARLREFDAIRVGESSSSTDAIHDLDVACSKLTDLTEFVRNLTRGRGSVAVKA